MTSVWALVALWLGLALIAPLLSIWLHTPFYFIPAGSFVSIPALMAAPFAFFFMLIAKIICKLVGVYPVTKYYNSPHPDAGYTTLLPSSPPGLCWSSIGRRPCPTDLL
jgi:hypothetical protein